MNKTKNYMQRISRNSNILDFQFQGKISLTVFIILSSIGLNLNGQNINFNYLDGSNSTYPANDVRKITFDLPLMNVYLWDGSSYSWNISSIGSLYYDNLNLTSVTNQRINLINFTLFPNPAESVVNIRYRLLSQDEITISVFDVHGKIWLEKKSYNLAIGEYQETLDVNPLPSGLYSCKISGKQFSITKNIIKQ